MHSNQTAINSGSSCSTIVLSENMTRDGAQRSYLMELPMELHICIREKLLTDPDSTFKELRPLRLVCKTFNDIWSPVVATSMVLFQTNATDDALVQLRHITNGKSDASTLAAYTTLTIQNLVCVDTEADRRLSGARRLRERGIIAVLRYITALLIWVSLGSIISLIRAILTVYPILSGIIYLALLPVKAINHIKCAMLKVRARYYMALLPSRLKMCKIRRVRLLLDYTCSDWVIHRLTGILLSLPHLTELELDLANAADLEYLVRCLKSLKGLQKLTLFPVTITPLRLLRIAALISNSENLTHFDWRPNTSPSFFALFCDVPTAKPLKLHHLSLGRACTNFDALIPHVRSLTSIEVRKGTNPWCIYFSRAKIFPQIIKVGLLDPALVTFIGDHPGLLSLSICSDSIRPGTEWVIPSFCKALMQHSETLQYLFFQSKFLASMLQNAENKAHFLQSTGNLRELVLETDGTLQQYENASSRIYSERQILSILAHASHSFAVIIRTRDRVIFLLCVAFCRDSGNPLIRDMAGRIMYERV